MDIDTADLSEVVGAIREVRHQQVTLEMAQRVIALLKK